MRKIRNSSLASLFILCICVFPSILPCLAERGFVLVHVQDAQQRFVAGVEIGVDGYGGSQLTGSDGKAKLPLGGGSKAGDWLTLSLLHSPHEKDFVMVSPWDNRVQIPSFEDKPENFIRVIVIQRSDKAALENGSVVASLVAKINKERATKQKSDRSGDDPKISLYAIAHQYGLSPDDLDKAIRELGRKTNDPYQAGLTALYERNYSGAIDALKLSLQQREATLETDKAILANDQHRVADTEFFLGKSNYASGNYRDAVAAFKKCLEIRGDTTSLSELATSMMADGDLAGAEPLYRSALSIDEKAFGPNAPIVGIHLNNLGLLLTERGLFSDAEPLYRRSISIAEQNLGTDDPNLAISLSNLAGLLQEKGDYKTAEQLYRRTLTTDRKFFASDDPTLARDMNNLAGVLKYQGSFLEAETLYLSALQIDEKQLGPDHPYVASALDNLAELLTQVGDLDDAEPIFRRALAIKEKVLGLSHLNVAVTLNNLGKLLIFKGDYEEANSLLERALAVDSGALGADHPTVAAIYNNMGLLSEAKGNFAVADLDYRRALAIEEKAVGSDHPTVASILINLALLLEKRGQQQEAELLFQKALVIYKVALGPSHPKVKRIEALLKEIQENHSNL